MSEPRPHIRPLFTPEERQDIQSDELWDVYQFDVPAPGFQESCDCFACDLTRAGFRRWKVLFLGKVPETTQQNDENWRKELDDQAEI